MSNKRGIFALLALFSIGAISGCASKGGGTGAAGDPASNNSTSDGSSITGQALGADDGMQAATGNLDSTGQQDEHGNTIYFEYNSSELTDKDKQIVDQHASYLINNPEVAVTLEGHADERGSREYNMALGEKRAHSIKQLLELKGVSKHQIKTVSFGEEKPESDGHSEDSWSKNRRAVFSFASN